MTAISRFLLAFVLVAVTAGNAPAQQQPLGVTADGGIIEYELVPIVYFDWNSARLRPGATLALDRAARNFQCLGQSGLRLMGHADTTGSPAYNFSLSQRRAEAVAAYLVRHGVPRSTITLDPKGDTRLLVETADNVRDERNRRVELVFRPGLAPLPHCVEPGAPLPAR